MSIGDVDYSCANGRGGGWDDEDDEEVEEVEDDEGGGGGRRRRRRGVIDMQSIDVFANLRTVSPCGGKEVSLGMPSEGHSPCIMSF